MLCHTNTKIKKKHSECVNESGQSVCVRFQVRLAKVGDTNNGGDAKNKMHSTTSSTRAAKKMMMLLVRIACVRSASFSIFLCVFEMRNNERHQRQRARYQSARPSSISLRSTWTTSSSRMVATLCTLNRIHCSCCLGACTSHTSLIL